MHAGSMAITERSNHFEPYTLMITLYSHNCDNSYTFRETKTELAKLVPPLTLTQYAIMYTLDAMVLKLRQYMYM